MRDEKFIKEKYMEMQYIDEQMKQTEQQIIKIDEQLNEVIVTKNALTEFGNTKTGTETLMPVSNGIFAKAEIKNNDKLLVNVGSNVVVEKSVEDTKKLMDNQLVELKNYKIKLMANMEKLSKQVKEIEKIVTEKMD